MPQASLARLRRLWELGGPALVVGRGLRYLSDELVALSAPAAFREHVADIADLSEAVDLAVGIKFRHYEAEVRSTQKPQEIEALLEELLRAPPTRVLEIGTWKGGTLFLLTRVAAPDATLVSIDLPGNGFGSSYPARYKRLYEAFARERQVVRLVRRDSHDPETVEEVRKLLAGPIDFLFVDGDHSYDGVRRDYELYAPLVRPGGTIAFHDIVAGDEAFVGGVPRFWRELKSQYEEVVEYVRDWEQGGCGIGVIHLPA